MSDRRKAIQQKLDALIDRVRRGELNRVIEVHHEGAICPAYALELTMTAPPFGDTWLLPPPEPITGAVDIAADLHATRITSGDPRIVIYEFPFADDRTSYTATPCIITGFTVLGAERVRLFIRQVQEAQ